MRRYDPEIKHSCESSWGGWIDTQDAVMEECRNGKWVKHQTAVDISRMHQARIARLEKIITRLANDLSTLRLRVFLGECCNPSGKSNVSTPQG